MTYFTFPTGCVYKSIVTLRLMNILVMNCWVSTRPVNSVTRRSYCLHLQLICDLEIYTSACWTVERKKTTTNKSIRKTYFTNPQGKRPTFQHSFQVWKHMDGELHLRWALDIKYCCTVPETKKAKAETSTKRNIANSSLCLKTVSLWLWD